MIEIPAPDLDTLLAHLAEIGIRVEKKYAEIPHPHGGLRVLKIGAHLGDWAVVEFDADGRVEKWWESEYGEEGIGPDGLAEVIADLTAPRDYSWCSW
jgi:hypothetical protein